MSVSIIKKGDQNGVIYCLNFHRGSGFHLNVIGPKGTWIPSHLALHVHSMHLIFAVSEVSPYFLFSLI